MKRIAIFGASEGGRRVRRALGCSVEVVAFIDNDPKKHGTVLGGVPVKAPVELATLDYEVVVIASMYAVQIHRQLHELGIAEGRVYLAPEAMLQAVPAVAWRGLGVLVGAFGLGLGLGALFVRWLQIF